LSSFSAPYLISSIFFFGSCISSLCLWYHYHFCPYNERWRVTSM